MKTTQSSKARQGESWPRKVQPGRAIAAKWLHDASFEAIETDAEQWERCREEFVEHDTPAAFV